MLNRKVYEIGTQFISELNADFLGKPYKGKLSIRQALDAMQAARQNAFDLAEEAKILFEHKKYARAFALSILSLEESGKCSVILRICCNSQSPEVSKLWRAYTQHKCKNFPWIIPVLNTIRDKITASAYHSMTSEEGQFSRIVDEMKMHALYSHVVDKGISVVPAGRITEEICVLFLDCAFQMATEDFTYLHEEPLKIWVKYNIDDHYDPINHRRMYEELAQKGFISELQLKGILRNIELTS